MARGWLFLALPAFFTTSLAASMQGGDQPLHGDSVDVSRGNGESSDAPFAGNDFESPNVDGSSIDGSSFSGSIDAAGPIEHVYLLSARDVEAEDASTGNESLHEMSGLNESQNVEGEEESEASGQQDEADAALEETHSLRRWRRMLKSPSFWKSRLLDLISIVVAVYAVIWAYGKIGCPFRYWPLRLVAGRPCPMKAKDDGNED